MIALADHLATAEQYVGTIPGAAERAMSRALNKASEAAKSSAVRTILSRYAAKASDVNGMITLTPSTPEKLEVQVKARSGSLSLGYFPHSPSTGGTGGPGRPALTAEIKRGDTKSIGGAFIANLNSGPRVMRRKPGGGIKGVYTIPLARMLGVESVRDAVEADAVRRVGEVLPAEIDRELKKAGAT